MLTPTASVAKSADTGPAAKKPKYARLTHAQKQEFLNWVFSEKLTVGHFAKKFGCSKQTLYALANATRKKLREAE